ncbi:MAG: hypothetical protein H6718_28085 [Polyangiaceae bacterium]|nr:hypothetical protein [Polyangiaceae bacterium]
MRTALLGPILVVVVATLACGGDPDPVLPSDDPDAGGTNTTDAGAQGGTGAVGSTGSGGDAGTTGQAASGGSGGTQTVPNIVKLRVGGEYTCAVTDQGTLICNKPLSVGGLISDIALGVNAACVIYAEDGSVGCQYWYDTKFNRVLKPSGAELRGVVSLAGFAQFCAIDTSGEGYCWGENDHGEVDPNDTADEIKVATSVGQGFKQFEPGSWFTCGLKTDGTLTCWGRDGVDATPVPQLKSVKALDFGASHACALRFDKSVWCWGDNRYGQLGYPWLDNDDWCGSDNCIEPKAVYGLPPVSELGIGSRHSCAVTEQGSVFCWGHGSRGVLGRGDEDYFDHYLPGPVIKLSGVKHVVSSQAAAHTCAVREDDTVWCWGPNQYWEIKCPEDVCDEPFPLKWLPAPQGAGTDPGGNIESAGLDCSAVLTPTTCSDCVEQRCCRRLMHCVDNARCRECLLGWDPTCSDSLAYSMYEECRTLQCYTECLSSNQ